VFSGEVGFKNLIKSKSGEKKDDDEIFPEVNSALFHLKNYSKYKIINS